MKIEVVSNASFLKASNNRICLSLQISYSSYQPIDMKRLYDRSTKVYFDLTQVLILPKCIIKLADMLLFAENQHPH